MDENHELLTEIESFCRTQGIAESTFGRRVVNDGKFVGRLRDGKGVTTSTVARVRRHMASRTPSGAATEETGIAAAVARGAGVISADAARRMGLG